ncbi:MAG: Gfo/Idh/MocA family oxidoreductase, partial [Bacteroidales bacterium]|nr:Gfo/Idh/MocA family oxidoreductase [Bacteroidales bacterium]
MTGIKTAIIGYGRMGAFYRNAILDNEDLELKMICDASSAQREWARQNAPEALVTDNPEQIYADPEIQLVILCALADSRKEQIERCFAAGKHVISEKPIGI